MSFKSAQPPAVSLYDRLKTHIETPQQPGVASVQPTTPAKLSRAQDVAAKVKNWRTK